jgi:hypothetical protein
VSRTVTGYAAAQRPLSVFISYAHEDEQFREGLDQHLGFLRRSNQLSIWHDRMVKPGEEWQNRLSEQLEFADIILLLVSPAFAVSDYCWGIEAKRALERHKQGDAIVIPILIRPVAGWAGTPLGKLQALPRDARQVSLWPNRDEAYLNIARGLEALIGDAPRNTPYAEPEWCEWRLNLVGAPEEYPAARREQIAVALRKAANAEELEVNDVMAGSAKLQIRSTQSIFNVLTALHSEQKLSGMIGIHINAIEPDLGAVLRVESRIDHGEYRSTIRYMPELFGGRSLEEGFPPFVGGIEFPLQNPLAIGFSLLSDALHPMPTEAEQVELQSRLGRYLNTFLVLNGENLHVNLTPTEPYCGLPELLRHTDLGRDMLAQDVVLKHYTASQMHPSTPHGRSFWDRVNALTSKNRNFESCFRVWIVPGNVAVREETVGDHGRIAIEKLGLEVLCEEDYDTLRRFRESQLVRLAVPQSPELDDAVVQLFKELILPTIQSEVSLGPRFGLLRQILSVLVVAKWIMQSQLGAALKQSGFIGSNAPDRFGLNTVDDRVLDSMKSTYMQMFGAGVWQYTSVKVDPANGSVDKRLYIAGGVVLKNTSQEW